MILNIKQKQKHDWPQSLHFHLYLFLAETVATMFFCEVLFGLVFKFAAGSVSTH